MKNRSAQRALAAMLSGLLILSLTAPVQARHHPQTDESVTQSEIESAQVSREIAEEGVVLLENKNQALPLPRQGQVALFGIACVQTTKGGTGSGSVNNRIVYEDGSVKEGVAIGTSILEGFENAGYEVLTRDYLVGLDEAAPLVMDAVGLGSAELADDTPLLEVFTKEELEALSGLTDTAIYALRRNAGEGSDRGIEDDYELMESELTNIHLLSEIFDKVVVVLNVVNCDASWFEPSGADALVLLCGAGEMGGDALVSVLNGERSPSGKLVDTWTKSIEDWPSTRYFSSLNPEDPWMDKVEYYYEDIFVGYRYFDTFDADAILYDFGYGLTYTTFDISVEEVEADGERITLRTRVTNTGKAPGKEVVQVYFSAPQGELLKPYQELAAYAKTDELGPGSSQVLTLSFPTSEFSSYSQEESAFVMEAGDYLLRVGNSSANTKVAAILTLDEKALTQKLSAKMAMDGTGMYPGGSSKNFPELTQEENVEEFDALYQAFLEESRQGRSLGEKLGEENLEETQIKHLSLCAQEIPCTSPYEGRQEQCEDVPLYVSATTQRELGGSEGYDFAKQRSYQILPVEYRDEEGNLINYRVKEGSEEEGTAKYYTLLDVQKGELTLEQFISGLSIYEMADLVEGGSKSPNAGGQSSGGQSANTQLAGEEVIDYINGESVSGQAGQTAGLYIASRMIPTMVNADGPAGLRLDQSYTGLDGEKYYQFCTAYPVGIMVAQTWNTDLAYRMGRYVGEEMKRYGITQWLAPGMNIHRNPLCGRNFEYFSEDPLVSGQMATYETLGVQSHPGVGVTCKHFVANNQENSRNNQNNVVSERALREIYLRSFEYAIRQASPMGVMSSYGLVNGTPTANDWELLEDILRTEWGFDGLVMTDWGGSGGMTDAMAMHAGNDLIMPGGDVSAKLLPYMIDCRPEITFDEEGIATEGGYPFTTSTTMSMGTKIWSRIYTNWGDYSLSKEGLPYTVVTTLDAFTHKTWPNVVHDVEMESTVQELVDALVKKGRAFYEIHEDGTVSITYKLVQNSSKENTRYVASYPDHAITVGENILGEKDYNTLSLADLQKSVKRILSVVLRSLAWQEVLYRTQEETGEDLERFAVGPYKGQEELPLAVIQVVKEEAG